MPKHKKKTKVEKSPWRRISVDVTAGVADAVSSVLLEAGALGLETEDDETRAVPGKEAVLTGRASITATFSREPGLEPRIAQVLKSLMQHVPEAADLTLEWSDLFAEDWNAIFRQHWTPFRCGTRTWVCPSWERERFVAERVGDGPEPIVLYLDAGMAFGTGTHETTQLCVAALEQHRAQRLLDVGTGTGILSIAALKLGAQRAKGTDIDPVAVATANENAAHNGVGDRFRATADAPDADGASYDVVVANILAGTLIELAAPITSAVMKGGRLFLSGILVDQERAVREAYVARGLTHQGTSTQNGWVRIDFVR